MSVGAAPAADAELNAIIALLPAPEHNVGLVYKGFTVWQALWFRPGGEERNALPADAAPAPLDFAELALYRVVGPGVRATGCCARSALTRLGIHRLAHPLQGFVELVHRRLHLRYVVGCDC